MTLSQIVHAQFELSGAQELLLEAPPIPKQEEPKKYKYKYIYIEK